MTRKARFTFAALCLLAGSSWLLEAALPPPFPGSLGLLVDHAVLALLFFSLAGGVARPAWSILGYSALLFAVPPALASLAGGHLSSTTVVLVYTLVPTATVFVAAQQSGGDLLRFLGPALAGVAGAALILPFALPPSLAGELSLAAVFLSALAAGLAGMRLHALLRNSKVCAAAALASAPVALVAVPLYAYERPHLVLLTWPQVLLSEAVHLAFAGATLLLSVRLLRALQPVAFSTRFLLIPLVTIAEGFLLLHPTVTWALPAGALLLAGGSALLFRPDTP